MPFYLGSIARWISNLFKPRRSELTRSHLVGMYLTQANGKDSKNPKFRQARERREGRFSQKRARF